MRHPRQSRRPVVPALTQLEDRSVPAGFSTGTIQGQDGWSGGNVAIRNEVAQDVRQSGFSGHAGVGTFVVSNNTSAGDFNGGVAGWPFGPRLGVPAGQSSAPAVADVFSATLWFRSVSATADGSNVEINLGTDDGSERMSYIGLANRADADGGLQIYLVEPDGSTGNLFAPEVEAFDLPRGVWHRLDVVATFRDGSANDSYGVWLNGTRLNNTAGGGDSFGTLEGYFEGQSQAYRTVSRLMFRSALAPSAFGAFSDAAAAGFAFDDVSYYSAQSSAPTTPLSWYSAAFETQPSLVYANPAYTAPITDADPNLPGNQPATLGVDAFTSLSAAAAAVAPGGRIVAFGNGHTGTTTIGTGTTLSVGGFGGAAAVSTGGDLNFASGATFEVDVFGPTAGTGYDELTVGGSSNIAGATLRVNAAYTPTPADTFTLLRAAAITGQFANAPEGTVITVGGFDYKVRYTSTTVTLQLDRADISVTVTDNRTSMPAGAVTTYTVVVRNDGPQAVSGVAVTVPIPAALLNAVYGSVASGGATGNTNGAGTISNLLTMPAGSFVTYTITGTVSIAFSGPLVLTATATPPAATVFDPNTANNTATDVTTVIPPDTTRPTVQVTANGTFTGGTPASVSLVFSEPVTGLTAGDLFFANASFVSLTGSGAVYTLTLVPGVGAVQVLVAEGAAADAAGNPNVTGVGNFTSNPPPLPTVPPPPPRVATSVGGLVRLIDPRDNSFREFTPFPGFAGPVTVATGDLNQDGVADVVVGAGPGGGPHVKAFDGRSGAEIASFFAYAPTFSGGVSVAVGAGRIVTGAGAGGGPHVRAFDPAGTEVASFYAYAESFTGGVRVAYGDVTGDGVADIVTGAASGGGPHVKAFDGRSGAEVASFYAFDAGYTGGVFVAAGGGRIAVGQATGGSAVKVFNGTGTEVASFTAYEGFTGGARVALTDVTGDGLPDLVTGAGPGGGPHVQAFTLPGIAPLLSFFAAAPGDLSAAGVYVG